MKNVKYVNKTSNPPAPVEHEPQWCEEWLPLHEVIPHAPFQVRNKLDKSAVKQYRDWTKAGRVPPPIKVGRVKGVLYLVDGHHRLAAGALVTRVQLFSSPSIDDTEVLALVRDMSEAQARWEAASVNMSHGVPLKPGEYRNVFKAFIAAKKHIKPGGKYMSLREMGEVLGKGHTTIYGWVRKYCPAILAKLEGPEHGNFEGDTGGSNILTLDEEHRQEASWAMQALVQHATALVSPGERWLLLKELEATAEQLRRAGVQEPSPEEF